jgi:hypothetical protein
MMAGTSWQVASGPAGRLGGDPRCRTKYDFKPNSIKFIVSERLDLVKAFLGYSGFRFLEHAILAFDNCAADSPAMGLRATILVPGYASLKLHFQ